MCLYFSCCSKTIRVYDVIMVVLIHELSLNELLYVKAKDYVRG